MASDDNDDSFENRRRRDRREEEEAEEEQRAKLKNATIPTTASKVHSQTSSNAVLEQMRLIDTMIDQVHNLYQMFIAGVERLPPKEKQALIEKSIANLQGNLSQTPATKFRFNTLNTRFLSYKDRWEKMMKNIESGKIKKRLK